MYILYTTINSLILFYVLLGSGERVGGIGRSLYLSGRHNTIVPYTLLSDTQVHIDICISYAPYNHISSTYIYTYLSIYSHHLL
ncbi:hypothetical protein BDB01DRAFT_70200 [Pilobolus umbonatus]|nr:hypothetical protein BDB01DRAFT_70200 [Pilobolus umbonatus]